MTRHTRVDVRLVLRSREENLCARGIVADARLSSPDQEEAIYESDVGGTVVVSQHIPA